MDGRTSDGRADQALINAATPADYTPPRGVADDDRALPLPVQFDIICLPVIDWDFRWQRPQQLLSQAADAGHRVFYVRTTAFRAPGEGIDLRRQRDRVWEVVLTSPGWTSIYAGDVTDAGIDAAVQALADLRDQAGIAGAILLVQLASWAPVAIRARERFGWRIVYDCMDEWASFPGVETRVVTEEQTLVATADLVSVSAEALRRKWTPVAQRLVLIRNAADFDHFATPAQTPVAIDLPRPLLGFAGAIAAWFDLELVLRLARERPAYGLLLLGGVFDVPTAELEALPNVRVFGHQPYAALPAYLQAVDVCLIPFRLNAVTQATDPVKFYEYISMGKPVVATAMAELEPYREHLYLADGPDAFLEAVDVAVNECQPERRQRRIELARANTWQARWHALHDAIASVHPPVSIITVTHDGLADTRQCLESVLQASVYPTFDLIVVDNASTDGTARYLDDLASRDSRVRVISNLENTGFAHAVNQGLAAATGDYLVILNNDTVVSIGWLPRLLRHATRPDVGLVVAVTNNSGNESMIAVQYSDRAALEQVAAARARDHDGESFDIRVAAMYCVATRRAVVDAVGELDERFGIGLFEDDDYSHRARLAGYRVICAEDVFVHHTGQASFGRLPTAERHDIWQRNQAAFEQKWQMAWQPHQPRQAVPVTPSLPQERSAMAPTLTRASSWTVLARQPASTAPQQTGACRLSVVVTCYRYLQRLRVTLRGWCEQRLDPRAYEVLVVNPHSPDGTHEHLAAVARAYAGRAIREVLVDADLALDKGSLVNAGVAASHGEWVWLTDADCLFGPTAAADVLAHVAGRPDHLYYGERRYLTPGHTDALLAGRYDGVRQFRELARLAGWREPARGPWGYTQIVHRSVLDRVPYQTGIGRFDQSDEAFIAGCRQAGILAERIPGLYCVHLDHPFAWHGTTGYL